jgi:hypothetical protein
MTSSPFSPRSFLAFALAPSLALIAVGSFVQRAAAQIWFEELPRQHVPIVADGALGAAAADVDGDGDVDLAVATSRQCRLLRNDGSGTYEDVTASHLPAMVSPCRSVLFVDMDGDGDLDLYLGNEGSTGFTPGNFVWRNDGTGHFTDVSAASLTTNYAAEREMVELDFEGDGDVDFVSIARFPSPALAWYLVAHRNQNGVLIDWTVQSQLPLAGWQLRDLLAVDVDGDGDRDLVTAGTPNRLFRNNGNAAFVEDTAALPLPPLAGMVGQCVEAADFDGDGDLDLWFGTNLGDFRVQNDGVTGLSLAPAGGQPASSGDCVGAFAFDMDGDGDADLLRQLRGKDTLYRNDNGVLVDVSSQLPGAHPETSRSLAADVDQDGDLDLVQFAELDGQVPLRPRVFWNDGVGRFVDVTAQPLPLTNGALAHGDIDGDGDVDAVFAPANGTTLRVCRNDGSGWFDGDSVVALGGAGNVRAVTLADLDGDGDLDLAAAGSGQDWRWTNDGFGGFQQQPMPAFAGPMRDVVAVDVDGDGDLDLVTAGAGQYGLFENQGGTFVDATAVSMPPAFASETRSGVASGDIDGDGDQDLVFGCQFPSFGVIYGNDGSGVFTDQTASRFVPNLFYGTLDQPRLADLDGDGDLDLVFGGSFGGSVFVNDGAGFFYDETIYRVPPMPWQVGAFDLADVDADGDLDLMFGNVPVAGSPVRDQLLRNDGFGYFTEATLFHLAPGASGSPLSLADVDADGDVDVLSSLGLRANLRRQLSVPWLLRPGRPWRLVAHSQSSSGPGTDFVVPWLGTVRVSVPVAPFGVLGIVPEAPLPAIVVPQPLGTAEVSLAVPNVPALAGAELFVQALVLTATGEARLTGVVRDVLVR